MPRKAAEVVNKVPTKVRVLYLAAAFVLASVTPATADEGVTFLGLDSDDAEDDAVAIAKSLEAELHARGDLATKQQSSSFTMLSAAARCPERPNVLCLKRLAKLIKVENFIWGLVRRNGTSIVVELHRFNHQPGPIYTQSLAKAASFNPKEAVSKLLGDDVNTSISITCAVSDGVVWIDEHARTIIRDSRANASVTANEPHTVEVRVAGKVVHRTTITPGGSGATWSCAGGGVGAEGGSVPSATTRMSSRRVAGYSLLGAGGLAAAVATIFTVKYVGNLSALDEARAPLPKTATDVCSPKLGTSAKVACSELQAADTSRAAAITAGIIGAALLGAGLYFTFSSESEGATITPSVSKETVGATVTLNF